MLHPGAWQTARARQHAEFLVVGCTISLAARSSVAGGYGTVPPRVGSLLHPPRLRLLLAWPAYLATLQIHPRPPKQTRQFVDNARLRFQCTRRSLQRLQSFIYFC